jgi:hypothetical protein
MGMHLPHHRKEDPPPVCPFGVFIKVGNFPKVHGSPCDRDYEKNDYVDKDKLSNYFLTPVDLQKLVTNRILNDPFFEKKFMKYFGSPDYWRDQNYRNEHWKKKGEICYFETVPPEAIKAILWPMWESLAVGDHFLADEFQDLTAEFKATFNIDLIIYRPYRDKINQKNWEKMEQRDWEMAMIEASHLAQKYYMDIGDFPDSIKFAKAYFKEKENEQ